MKKLSILGTMLAAATMLASTASAALIGATAGGTIIAAPANVLEDGTSNTGQQGFDEMQNVLLGLALSVDGGSIAAGTLIDSHMIFYNTAGSATTTSGPITWTFSGTVLGVMSDSTGALETASSPLLGAAGTIYELAPFAARGLEAGSPDGYSILGNTLTVTMQVSEPGDWIRVITASEVPEPGTWALMGLGLLGLGLAKRKRA